MRLLPLLPGIIGLGLLLWLLFVSRRRQKQLDETPLLDFRSDLRKWVESGGSVEEFVGRWVERVPNRSKITITYLSSAPYPERWDFKPMSQQDLVSDLNWEPKSSVQIPTSKLLPDALSDSTRPSPFQMEDLVKTDNGILLKLIQRKPSSGERRWFAKVIGTDTYFILPESRFERVKI